MRFRRATSRSGARDGAGFRSATRRRQPAVLEFQSGSVARSRGGEAPRTHPFGPWYRASARSRERGGSSASGTVGNRSASRCGRRVTPRGGWTPAAAAMPSRPNPGRRAGPARPAWTPTFSRRRSSSISPSARSRPNPVPPWTSESRSPPARSGRAASSCYRSRAGVPWPAGSPPWSPAGGRAAAGNAASRRGRNRACRVCWNPRVSCSPRSLTCGMVPGNGRRSSGSPGRAAGARPRAMGRRRWEPWRGASPVTVSPAPEGSRSRCRPLTPRRRRGPAVGCGDQPLALRRFLVRLGTAPYHGPRASLNSPCGTIV